MFVTQDKINCSSLPKECPRAEYLTSLPNRRVGALLSVPKTKKLAFKPSAFISMSVNVICMGALSWSNINQAEQFQCEYLDDVVYTL